MPTDTAAPASTTNPTPAPSETAKPVSKSADLAARLNAMDAKQASAGETPPTNETPAPRSRDATKLAQALTKATTAEKQALDHKTAREKAEGRVKDLETQVQAFEEARKDINKLLQYGKVTPDQLAEMFMGSKLKFTPEPDAPPAPELPDDVKRDLEYARSKRTAEEAEAAQKQADEAHAAAVSAVKDDLAPLAEKYPLVAALPGAADRMLEAVLITAGFDDVKDLPNLPEDFDFEALVKGAEEAVANELKAVAGSDAALKTLVADEAIATKLRALLGVQTPRAKVNPPAMTTRNTSAIPSTKTGWDPAAAAARLNSLSSK